jgi:hypothetical protein
VNNFIDWFAQHSDANQKEASIFSQLRPQHKSSGIFQMVTQIDAELEGAETMLNDLERFVTSAAPAAGSHRRTLPWLHATLNTVVYSVPDTTRRFKGKSAYLRKRFTTEQVASLYSSLTRSDYNNPAALVMLTAYGGAINSAPWNATASFQRDSVVKINFIVFWDQVNEDDEHLSWIRRTYKALFDNTGGVPTHNAQTSGCYVGYADTDLQDPSLNQSGLSYEHLYWGDNFPRLANTKAAWDPSNIFSHAQSIRTRI